MATTRKKASLRVEVDYVEVSGRGELIQVSGAGRATTESVRGEVAKARARSNRRAAGNGLVFDIWWSNGSHPAIVHSLPGGGSPWWIMFNTAPVSSWGLNDGRSSY